MSLESDQASWEYVGREDPLWAVYTDAGRRHGGWDDAAFFASGEREIERFFAFLEATGLVPAAGRALDFGCGIGRLTRALSSRFAAVTASTSRGRMLDAAARRNHDRGTSRSCTPRRPGSWPSRAAQCGFVISLIGRPRCPVGQFGRSTLSVNSASSSNSAAAKKRRSVLRLISAG